MKGIRQLINVNRSDHNVLNNELTIYVYAMIMSCYKINNIIIYIIIDLLRIKRSDKLLKIKNNYQV